MASTYRDVYTHTAKKVQRLLSISNLAHQKAELANLRRGVGHSPGELPPLWGAFLEDMPEEMYGSGSDPSRAEWAVYTALTLFALHQQGHDPAREPMYLEGQTLGKAVGHLATDEEEMNRILRRLNAAATANSISSLAYHLRGLVQLLRAKSVPLDYAALASDIYRYQFPESAGQVRLAWAQDFYGYYNKNKDGEDKES